MAAAFVDTARITVQAGNGGNGAVAFHREKYVAAGGPDGGDGGRGRQHHLCRWTTHLSTLMDFRYKRKYVAENGEDGRGKRCSGKERAGPGHPGPPGHPGAGCRDRRDHPATCPGTSPLSLGQGRQGRLGQQALRHPHPPGAPLRQGGPAGRGAAS